MQDAVEQTATGQAAIWVRCDDPAQTAVLFELEEAIQIENPNIWFEITLPQANGPYVAHPLRTGDIESFCTELDARLVIWAGGVLDPKTLSICNNRKIPVIVIDAGVAMLPRVGRGWFPGKTRALLSQLTQVFARTAEAADALIRAGVHEHRIVTQGSLEAQFRALPCDEEDRYDMAQQLGPRPIWLAAGIDRDELDIVTPAIREASRRAHRLLCVMMPSANSNQIQQYIRERGLAVTSAENGEMPTDGTQVHLVNEVDAALWYRLSPITYIGGSHSTGARVDPFYLATVGSVCVHGQQTGAYAAHFNQLTASNATYICDDASGLGAAVAHLLSADKAATIAQRGWEVTSRGADMMNQLSTSIVTRIAEDRAADAGA